MLRGAETGERFERREDGTLVPAGCEELRATMTECVSPSIGDIHRVSNSYDDRVSISIHVYGADIGKVERHVYVPETGELKRFVSGYAQPA
jgi:predicted metal-dependent enzyme (double-stranded beta helix superfamily)